MPLRPPICDFAEHIRVSDRTEHIPASSLLIVEGILALHFARLRQYFNPSTYPSTWKLPMKSVSIAEK